MSTPIRIQSSTRSGGGHSNSASNGGDEPIGAPSSSLPSLLNSIMSGTSPADYKPPPPNAHDPRKDREGHFMVDSQQHPNRPSSSGSASSRMTSNSSSHSLDADLLGATDDSPVAVASNRTATLHAYQPPNGASHHDHSLSTDGLSQFYGLNLPPTPSEVSDANTEFKTSGYQPTSPHQQQQPSQTSPVQSSQGRRSIPSHKPPPPPVTSDAESTLAAPAPAAAAAPAATTIAIDPAALPSGRGSFSATSANGGAQLSPKTSKLLRRIKRREEELEELTLENDLLKEANRRANEEKIVREQERRVEARKRAEADAQREAELNSLKSQLAEREQVDAAAPKHDPFECQRTIDELTELLQLREEQLELINLDRSKLYEEIETWKLGMEKLASLQAHATHAAVQAAQNNTTVVTAGSGAVLDESPAVFGARSTSEFKSDSSSVALSPLSANSANSSQPVNAAVAAAAAALSGIVAAPALASTAQPSTPAAPATPSVPLNLDPVVEEIWENQHRHPFFGWVPTRYPLRPAFSDESGTVSKPFEEQKLPPGFVWDGAWKLDAGEWLDANSGEEGRTAASTILHAQEATANASSKLATLRSSIGLGSKTPASSPTNASQPVGTDAEGWRYSLQFKLFAWHSSCGRLDTVRRRRWLRRRIWVGIEATEAMLQNALKAVREIGGVVNPTQLLQPETEAVHSEEEEEKEATSETAASTSAADKPTLASLAAAYSSGAPGDSFSMFISAPPPEVTRGTADQNPESSAAKALAALMQLGGFGPNAPVVPTADSSASTSSATSSSAASTPVASPAASASVIANLSSYLASTRVVGLFGRKSVAPPTVSTDAAAVTGAPAVTPSPSSADFSLGSAAAPSSVCSFCSNPSHTALQYIDPETYSVVPIASYCNAHYHQCQKHIVLEFQAANPTPLSSAEIKRREALGKDLNPSICCYCDQTETFPVRLLHLKTISKDDSSEASAALPSVEVLDANDAYRFCSAHMSPFIKLVREFQPTTTSPSAAAGVASPSGSSVTHEEAMKGAAIVTSSSSSPIRPPHDVQAMLEAIENEDLEL